MLKIIITVISMGLIISDNVTYGVSIPVHTLSSFTYTHINFTISNYNCVKMYNLEEIKEKKKSATGGWYGLR